MARPTKLTPELEKKLLDYVRAGNYLETACAACRIESKTLRNWREMGAKGRKPYAAFCEALAQAEAEAEIMMVALINQAATGFRTIKDRNGNPVQVPVTGDWKAKAWLGERKLARRWGQKVRFEVDSMVEDFLRHLKTVLDADTFHRVLNAAQVWRDSGQTGSRGSAGEVDLAAEFVATDPARGSFEATGSPAA